LINGFATLTIEPVRPDWSARLSLMFSSYPFSIPGSFGSVMRNRTPPLESGVTQISARSSKSPYDSFETRKPLGISASRILSTTRQLALPVFVKRSRFDPSNNIVHPASVCARAAGTPMTPAAAMKNVAMITAVARIVSAP